MTHHIEPAAWMGNTTITYEIEAMTATHLNGANATFRDGGYKGNGPRHDTAEHQRVQLPVVQRSSRIGRYHVSEGFNRD
jgi:hypothetical protein